MFKNLYKYSGFNQPEERQAIRREKLLEEQRKKREQIYSQSRNFNNPIYKGKSKVEKDYTNLLSLSEWMVEPIDIEEFILFPCPKGIRVTLSNEKSNHQIANLYYKSGKKLQLDLKTNLPRKTILDCIYAESSRTLFILDVIKYEGRSFINCDTAFRQYWIKSKFSEDELQVWDDRIKYELIESYEAHKMHECFHKHPIYEDAILDGYLFYHKEADYIVGDNTTPLILWILPFMIEEVLNITVHPLYHASKPDNYTNYMDFIKEFNSKMKRKRYTKRSGEEEMDHEVTNEKDVINETINLEVYGDIE